MRPLFAMMLAAVLILSGCLGGGDDPEIDGGEDDSGAANGSQGTGDGPGSNGTNGSGNGGNGEQTTLEASLSANVTSGFAPLTVEFTLGASDSGGEVSWELDLGNDTVETGDELPATVSYAYDAPDNYTVLLTVTMDGRSALANLTIRVEEVPIPPPNPLQEGGNSDCLDALVLRSVPGVISPGAVEIVVDPLTRWVGNASEGRFTIDFYNDNDNVLEANPPDVVPESAAYGLVCIRQDGNPLPASGATWAYQDGFQPEETED